MEKFILQFVLCVIFINVSGQKLNIDYSIMNKNEKFVTNLEMRTLEWSRLHKLDSLSTIVPYDYLGIFSSTGTKRNTRKDALTYSNDFVLRSYQVDNLVTCSITPEVIIISYEMLQDGEDGKGINGQARLVLLQLM